MKLHKGYFYVYAATGESTHFYVWKGNKEESHDFGKKHVIIKQLASFELYEPDTGNTFRIYQWDYERKLNKREKEVFQRAIKENWKVHMVEWFEPKGYRGKLV